MTDFGSLAANPAEEPPEQGPGGTQTGGKTGRSKKVEIGDLQPQAEPEEGGPGGTGGGGKNPGDREGRKIDPSDIERWSQK